MIDVNFREISKHVNTQYGDFAGAVQIDLQHRIEIYKMCEECGFDANNKFIVGIQLFDSSINGINGFYGVSEAFLTVLYASKSDYGKSFDEIEAKIIADDGSLVVHQEKLRIEYATLGKYIKRLSVMLTSPIAKTI